MIENMQTWTTRTPDQYGPGPWSEEPDKAQWVDAATGYDCLIKRNQWGALCGYVGVPQGHPFYGLKLNWDGDDPLSELDVHGGVTFAEGCHEPTHEWYEAVRRGDTDQMTRDKVLNELARTASYEEWAAACMPHLICHVPLPGRPAKVHWIGFDCSHALDYQPAYDNAILLIGMEGYKDMDYVIGECTRLAQQLKEVENGNSND
jgi:hypothetical protein